MSPDDLEKFLLENRNQFDQVEQPEMNRLWSDFNKRRASIISGPRYWMIAAAIAFLLTATAGLIGYSLGGKAQPTLADLIRDDQQLSDHYTHLTSEIFKREEEIAAKNIQKQDYEALFTALEELDGMQRIYEAELVNYSNEQALIKSLLQHHEKKVRLLELLLFEVEKKSKNEQRDQFNSL